MTSKELRQIIKDFPKFEGSVSLPPASVIHEGFPSCFNLSFAEYELFHRYGGQYLDFDKDFIFSKFQPCIRHQDWKTIVNDDENTYRYLSLFDMVDLSGFILLKDGSSQEITNKFAIKAFVDFVKHVGLDISKLRISYFEGGSIEQATNGKYKLSKTLPQDPMIEYWKSLGIKDNQFIVDKTRDTLLSLRIFGNPTAWGYRNEINYEYKGKLLDIGTVEFLPFRPVFDTDGEIVDVVESSHIISIAAIGFERFLMILNNLENVWDVDYIKPLIDKLKELKISDHGAMVATQAIRAIHRIVTDNGEYKNLNTRRKEYIRWFYKEFFRIFDTEQIELTESLIFDILRMNAEFNSAYPELSNSIEVTKQEIINRKIAFNNDRSIKKNKGV
jgi:hypothetical protein